MVVVRLVDRAVDMMIKTGLKKIHCDGRRHRPSNSSSVERALTCASCVAMPSFFSQPAAMQQ